MTETSFAMKVAARRDLTATITEFTLEPTTSISLPSFTAGAHLTLRTPSGAMRRYSLINDGTAPTCFVLGIKREAASRGGSQSMHEQALVGTELAVTSLENSFALSEAPDYLLIAGGIGVTPIYAMARELERKGKPFRIIYCTRTAEETAYLDELRAEFGARLHVHHDDGDPTQAFDFWDEFEEPRKTQVYCCGPKPLMAEIDALSGHWPEGRVNFEDFRPVETVRPDDMPFEVELKRSGRIITVPAERSILEALRDAGVATTSSCESGTCGTCKTGLISGDVEHRDMVLMDDERDSHIMICISRAHAGRLVLDL